MFNYEEYDYGQEAPEGYIEIEHVPDLDHCQFLIQSLVTQIYKDGNVDEVENLVDELARQFSGAGYAVKMPEREKKPVIKSDLLTNFAELTRCYAASLKGKQK